MGLLFSFIKGLAEGTKEAVTDEKKNKKELRDAYKDLKQGNPDTYEGIKGYLDDDIIANYPVEEEDLEDDDYYSEDDE